MTHLFLLARSGRHLTGMFAVVKLVSILGLLILFAATTTVRIRNLDCKIELRAKGLTCISFAIYEPWYEHFTKPWFRHAWRPRIENGLHYCDEADMPSEAKNAGEVMGML